MKHTIREIREKNGLTQVQLSQLSGLTQATVSDLENGKIKSPSLDAARKIAKALGVSLDELFESELETKTA